MGSGYATSFAVLLAAAGSAQAAQPGSSDDPAPGYPARPIRFIVPSAAGGAADINARLLAAELTKLMR